MMKDFPQSRQAPLRPTATRSQGGQAQRGAAAGAVVIANVMGGGHFVLVVGYDDAAHGDVLFVNDPGFTRPSYSFANDVVGWRLYAMARGRGAKDLRGQLDVLSRI